MSSKKIELLQEQLQKAAAAPALNIDQIVELSSELAKRDPEFVRFSTDAAIISRLGRELVAKQETAVAELIKNAYDADARQVTLTFTDADRPGGMLEIDDDGLGMSRKELIKGFMRLSSTEKVSHPSSPRFKRRRAGRKGIGRFAVQRLGEGLIITTQTADDTEALRVQIDWNAFEGGRDLASIANRITSVPKTKLEGTTLVVTKLREGWSEAAIRRVYRFVSDLLQPFPLRSSLADSDRAEDASDPGFKVALYRSSGDDVAVVADEEVSVLSHALAVIEGYVDSVGNGYWSVVSDRLGIEELIVPIGPDREDHHVPYNRLRNVSMKAYYFIFLRDLIPRTMFSTIQSMAQEKGGIRVYRNGFRVPPYGEQDDDWLGLNASSRAREILPPHANGNFFGFVEIIDPEGAQFEETSSREGLLENEALRELQSFCSRVLKAATLRVAEVRGRKQTADQRDWVRPGKEPSEAVREIADELSAAVAESQVLDRRTEGASVGDSEQLSAKVARAANALVQVAEQSAARERELLEELGMLRVLASLGLVIGEFTHEVRQIIGATHLSAQQLMDSLKEQPEIAIAEDLLGNVQRFRTYASYFDHAIAENASRELTPQDLRFAIRQFIKSVRPSVDRAGILLEAEITGYDLVTVPMHTSELASILFNFYSNSYKAIKRAHAQGRILIRSGTADSKVYLEFADNGDGIPPENEDRIFNAFFTTSAPAGMDATEDEEMQGTGLGLKIVRDIVESYDGEVGIVSPPDGYNTCLRVEIPKGSEEEYS